MPALGRGTRTPLAAPFLAVSRRRRRAWAGTFRSAPRLPMGKDCGRTGSEGPPATRKPTVLALPLLGSMLGDAWHVRLAREIAGDVAKVRHPYSEGSPSPGRSRL